MTASTKRFDPVDWPWTGRDDGVAINIAIGSMRQSLKMWVTIEGRIHAETLLASIGALAGFTAIHSALNKVVKRDVPVPEGEQLPSSEAAYLEYLAQRGLLLILKRPSGETFYLGDLINGHLVPQGINGYRVPESPTDFVLWRFLAGAAIDCGFDVAGLPDYNTMFRHVAGTLGTPEFGVLQVPKQHQPHLPPRQLLDLFWLRAKFILTRTDGPGPAKGYNAPVAYWPLIMNFVAGQLLAETAQVVDPRIGAALVLESAIAMSKLDPQSVPQPSA